MIQAPVIKGTQLLSLSTQPIPATLVFLLHSISVCVLIIAPRQKLAEGRVSRMQLILNMIATNLLMAHSTEHFPLRRWMGLRLLTVDSLTDKRMYRQPGQLQVVII